MSMGFFLLTLLLRNSIMSCSTILTYSCRNLQVLRSGLPTRWQQKAANLFYVVDGLPPCIVIGWEDLIADLGCLYNRVVVEQAIMDFRNNTAASLHDNQLQMKSRKVKRENLRSPAEEGGRGVLHHAAHTFRYVYNITEMLELFSDCIFINYAYIIRFIIHIYIIYTCMCAIYLYILSLIPSWLNVCSCHFRIG